MDRSSATQHAQQQQKQQQQHLNFIQSFHHRQRESEKESHLHTLTDPKERQTMAADKDSSRKRKRRRNRWGDANAAASSPLAAENNSSAGSTKDGAAATASSQSPSADQTKDARSKALALQASVKARLEALKQKKQQQGSSKDAAKPVDKSKVAALQASVKARLEAMKHKKRSPDSAGAAPLPAAKKQRVFEGESATTKSRPTKKAKVYELDMTAIPTRSKAVEATTAAKPIINPYLAHRTATDTSNTDGGEGGNDNEGPVEDDRLERVSKPRKRNKAMRFVEPGTFVALADRKREKAANAIESGFVSGRKAGNFVQSTGLADIYGGGGAAAGGDDTAAAGDKGAIVDRPDCGPPEKMPLVMEWWDLDFLPSKLKKQVEAQEKKAQAMQNKARMLKVGKLKDDEAGVEAVHESDKVVQLRKTCFDQVKRSHSKTSDLVQHPVPIRAHPEEAPKEATLYLTKRELKRQRKLRRAEKLREQQDLQAAGLIPAPEPKLTLQNFIKVLGDQAYLDPTQMEQKVMEQVEARKRAHLERNAANKLTKEQRSAKRARKLAEDTTKNVSVAIFFVKDMSHPYHRAKVDLNAQQNDITGGVLECQNPPVSCVICEGGPKAIKRYTRLMLVRMKWAGTDDDDDDDGDEEMNDMDNESNEDGEERKPKAKFNRDNTCALVWSGMNVKRLFKGFVFQACETSAVARKVLSNKGVGHYWDQVLAHYRGEADSFHFKLADEDDDEEGGDAEDGGMDVDL